MKTLIIVTVVLLNVSSIAQNNTVDLSDVNQVKAHMAAQWSRPFWKGLKRLKIIETYSFSADSTYGHCYSSSYISSATLFIIRREDNKTIMYWAELTGGGYQVEIAFLSSTKLITVYEGKKTVRKRLKK